MLQMRPTALLQATTIAVIFAITAGAAPDECFRGEIVDAEDFAKVVVVRAHPRRGDDSLGRHTPLYGGDTLIVQGDQVVWIRDRPGGELREVTAGQGRVKISEPETCEVRDDFENTLGALMVSLGGIVGGPVADEPVVTYPRSDEPSGGVDLALKGTQLLTSDLDTLSVHWRGPDAHVELRSPADAGVRASSESTGTSLVEARIERPLQVGETLELELETKNGAVSRTIRVVPRDQLPKPDGIGSLDGLSVTERTIYAIWLAARGPLEWRLQGISLLAEAARDDYMAWKVLRALRAAEGDR